MSKFLPRILLIISLVAISIINTSHQTIQDTKCLGDVNNDLVVDDRDMQIIKDNFNLDENDMADIIPMLYSYGEDCRVKIYLPVVFKDMK